MTRPLGKHTPAKGGMLELFDYTDADGTQRSIANIRGNLVFTSGPSLTRAQVQQLVVRLQTWIETGRLKMNEESHLWPDTATCGLCGCEDGSSYADLPCPGTPYPETIQPRPHVPSTKHRIRISLPGVLERAAKCCEREGGGNTLGFSLLELLKHLREVRADMNKIDEFLDLWTDQ